MAGDEDGTAAAACTVDVDVVDVGVPDADADAALGVEDGPKPELGPPGIPGAFDIAYWYW